MASINQFLNQSLSALSALLCLSLLLAGGHARAGGYVGLDGSSLDIANAQNNEINPRGMRVRLGMPVAPMFDVELHLGGGKDAETLAADRFTAVYAGAFLKGYLPVGSRSALFGLAGYTSVDLTQTVNGQEFSDDRGSFSYGFGMETEISRRLDLSADYMNYVRDDGSFSEISAINLGIKYYF